MADKVPPRRVSRQRNNAPRSSRCAHGGQSLLDRPGPGPAARNI